MELGLRLFEFRFGAQLAFDTAIPLPNRINKLRLLLETRHYVAIQILTEAAECAMDIIVLRQFSADAGHAQHLYPIVPSAMSPAVSAPSLLASSYEA